MSVQRWAGNGVDCRHCCLHKIAVSSLRSRTWYESPLMVDFILSNNCVFFINTIKKYFNTYQYYNSDNKFLKIISPNHTVLFMIRNGFTKVYFWCMNDCYMIIVAYFTVLLFEHNALGICFCHNNVRICHHNPTRN